MSQFDPEKRKLFQNILELMSDGDQHELDQNRAVDGPVATDTAKPSREPLEKRAAVLEILKYIRSLDIAPDEEIDFSQLALLPTQKLLITVTLLKTMPIATENARRVVVKLLSKLGLLVVLPQEKAQTSGPETPSHKIYLPLAGKETPQTDDRLALHIKLGLNERAPDRFLGVGADGYEGNPNYRVIYESMVGFLNQIWNEWAPAEIHELLADEEGSNISAYLQVGSPEEPGFFANTWTFWNNLGKIYLKVLTLSRELLVNAEAVLPALTAAANEMLHMAMYGINVEDSDYAREFMSNVSDFVTLIIVGQQLVDQGMIDQTEFHRYLIKRSDEMDRFLWINFAIGPSVNPLFYQEYLELIVDRFGGQINFKTFKESIAAGWAGYNNFFAHIQRLEGLSDDPNHVKSWRAFRGPLKQFMEGLLGHTWEDPQLPASGNPSLQAKELMKDLGFLNGAPVSEHVMFGTVGAQVTEQSAQRVVTLPAALMYRLPNPTTHEPWLYGFMADRFIGSNPDVTVSAWVNGVPIGVQIFQSGAFTFDSFPVFRVLLGPRTQSEIIVIRLDWERNIFSHQIIDLAINVPDQIPLDGTLAQRYASVVTGEPIDHNNIETQVALLDYKNKKSSSNIMPISELVAAAQELALLSDTPDLMIKLIHKVVEDPNDFDSEAQVLQLLAEIMQRSDLQLSDDQTRAKELLAVRISLIQEKRKRQKTAEDTQSDAEILRKIAEQAKRDRVEATVKKQLGQKK